MIRFLFFFIFFSYFGAIAQKSVFIKSVLNEEYRVANETIKYKGEQLSGVYWMYPLNALNQGELYERFELGIDLPKDIKKKIDYFIATDDSINGINPFLEWQLDITAKFTHTITNTVKNVDAFYYENFERDTSNTDFRKWTWIQQETGSNMRIRFAPPDTGRWKCEISVHTKDTAFIYAPFIIKVKDSDNAGYLKVGKSKRFFTLGEETFFPAGQNIMSPRCEFCFVNSAMGLPTKGNTKTYQSFEGWMIQPSIVKGFTMYLEHIQSLADNGGNYFRQILLPQNQDIEWEKLGNYYGRLNRAWEIDNQFFLANELDLKMQLNLQIQFALETERNRVFWNWSRDPQDKRHLKSGNPCANPYNLEISTTKNDDSNTFFSDKTAKKFYKQKLRYIISRWGYSTSLAVIGMASEIQTPCTASDTCVSWMREMGDYLKNDLKIDQLLAPSFLGGFSDAENYENRILEMDDYDFSAYNWYSASSTKYEGLARKLEGFTSQFDKPFFFGEVGTGDLYPCDTARIEWVRDVWMDAFSGNAGVGLNWDEQFDDDLRKHLGHIQKFVNGVDLDGKGNPWKSQRILSDNRKAETIFLLSPDKEYAIGVISNRYYNWYLDGDTLIDPICKNRIPIDPGFDASKPAVEKGVWEKTYAQNPINYIDNLKRKSEMNDPKVYSPFEAFDYETGKNYRLRIYGLLRASYTIDFYNALTMEYLGSQSNWGPSVKLEYPEMNKESGLIAFKLRLSKNEKF